MKNRIFTTMIALIVLTFSSLAYGQDKMMNNDKMMMDKKGGQKYQVSITNLTKGQVFTPIIVASHSSEISLYKLGEPASLQLENLAESGNTKPLMQMLSGSAMAMDMMAADKPLKPGKTMTLTVMAGGKYDRISVASMLVPTNDAFFAINGAKIPVGNDEMELWSPAYDAGTERNDEECGSIPGPPNVCEGEGFNKSRERAEGFVSISSGIRGIDDLSAHKKDWKNPVARVTILRLP